jgi:exopolyphosphatase / guanosine-5'-triphosphate,3'-diphosphate pyrophosphatase
MHGVTSPHAQLPDAAPATSVAAIDVGTHTALLLIARQLDDGRLETVEDHAFAARLGAGMSEDGDLSSESRQRTLDVLTTFARRIELHGIPNSAVSAVSTAVLRRARDRAAFCDDVRRATGLELRIIEGAEEARLSWKGAAHTAAAALVDVGGGSTEILGPDGQFVASVLVGAAWSTERFGTGGVELPGGGFDSTAMGRLEEYADAAFVAAGVTARAADAAPGVATLVGGAAVNLGCLVAEAEAFDHRVGEGVEATSAQAAHWARRLAALSLEDRYDLPIEPDRAAVLPAGLALLGRALVHMGLKRGRVTGRGLRHGLALELAARL